MTETTQKPTVLYVDDEESNLIAFAAAFRRYYNIFTAKSAKEGIKALRENKIQIIITDQRMPEMTGVQFLEAIMPEFPDPIRMIMTGFSDVEAIIKSINMGQVFRYISKPWDEAELKQIIDSTLKLYNAKQRNLEIIQESKEQIERQQHILNAFQKYVPENVIESVLTSPSDQTIFEGELRVISVLFSDIRKFTTLAERLSPKQSLQFLNNYFTAMTAVVNKYKGTVINFIGDGCLAIFGAPISTIDNQSNAVLCALEMMDVLKEFNAQYSEELDFETVIGIGINTGDAVIGNIGSEERIAYSAVGDTVNLAMSISDLTKEYPNSILINESTFIPTQHSIISEEFGKHVLSSLDKEKIKIYMVKGKKEKEKEK